jgi:uncharacterized protein (TIGR03437 family)
MKKMNVVRNYPFTTLFVITCLSLFISNEPAQAQSITVRNFLNPNAPVARESFALIEGENFTNEQLVAPFNLPTVLGGVSVSVEGVLQRIRSVSPTRVVILVDSSGPATRTVELKTKSNVTSRTTMQVATAWPGVFVQNTVEDSDSFIPTGLWTVDGIQLRPLTSAPLPVGPPNRPTLVVIQGSGWRFAPGLLGVKVRLNGIPCKVIASRPSSLFEGQDELVFEIPSYLAGRGMTDVIISIGSRESNFARVNLGEALSLK